MPVIAGNSRTWKVVRAWESGVSSRAREPAKVSEAAKAQPSQSRPTVEGHKSCPAIDKALIWNNSRIDLLILILKTNFIIWLLFDHHFNFSKSACMVGYLITWLSFSLFQFEIPSQLFSWAVIQNFFKSIELCWY